MSKFTMKRFVQCALVAALIILIILYIQVPLGAARLTLRAAMPLLLGCVLAYILNLLLVRIESVWFPHSRSALVIRTRRGICILLSLICLTAIVAAVVLLVLPELRSSAEMIARDLPLALAAVQSWLIQHSDQFPSLQEWLTSLNLNWPALVERALNLLLHGATGIFNTTVSILSAVVNWVITFVIGLIFSLYLLVSKERLASQFHRLADIVLKPRVRNGVYYVLNTVHRSFSSFIVGQCVEAIILGVLCTLGMTVLRLPYAVVVGVVVGVSALIPVAGAYLGGFIGFFLLVMVNPMQALIFLIFLVVLQQVEGDLIYPRVVGGSIGLPGIWVLAVVTVGGGIMGVPGMLLGVPSAAALYRLLSDFVRRREAAEAEAAAAASETPAGDTPSSPAPSGEEPLPPSP